MEETVARMDGEATEGPVEVTGRDLQQWNKVVCCVTVTANVYQAGTGARAPRDVEMIVSAKPQHDSRAQGGYRLCANAVATFDSPHTSLVGKPRVHTNVMFYKAGDTCNDSKTQGKLYVHRENCVKDMAGVREELSNEKLIVVPFVPNPPLSWIYDESSTSETGSPWVTKYQQENKDREPHAGAFLEFESLRCEIKEEVIVKLAAEIAFSLLKAKDVVVMYLANSARVEFTPTHGTECTLTVTTADGESSEITCSPSMLGAARVDLERLTPRSNPDMEPGPTRITHHLMHFKKGAKALIIRNILTENMYHDHSYLTICI